MRKYKKTYIGSIILLLILVVSCLYPLYGPGDFNKKILLTDDLGNVVGRAPFPPSEEHLLGTNRNGEDMHLLLLYGAKFTLITAFGVALLRVFFGGIIGIVLSFWAPFLKKYFKAFFLVFRYIPAIFLGILIMGSVFGVNTGIPISSIVTYQITMLVFMGFPSVTIFTMDFTTELLKTNFVQSSYLMGASHLHVMRRQLMPYIRSYGILFTVQQFLSTLQIIMHLGIFGYYLGGQSVGGTFGYDKPPKPASLSNEWAGLIGQNLHDFMMAPWTIFTPILGFFIVIIVVNMVKKEVEENLLGTQMVKRRKREMVVPTSSQLQSPFEFVRKEQSQGF